MLGNPHESIFPAIYGTTQVEDISALGILETYDAASIIEAADQAAKTAIVDLIELRIAKGMCGKSYMMITGEVSAVEASIDRAKELVAAKGMYLDSSVIAHPDRRMIDSILSKCRKERISRFCLPGCRGYCDHHFHFRNNRKEQGRYADTE